MTVKERPRINRAQVLEEERAWRRIRSLLRASLGTLAAHERLGDPYRDGPQIIIPIVAAHEAEADPVSLQALVAAWLDEPDS